MTDRELLQQALDSLEWSERRYSHVNLDLFNKPIEAIRTRLAQPEKEWVGLTDDEIKNTKHHMVDGAYDYSFKQGAQWAEAKLKEKNT